ncbi:hypothetical protein HYX58_04730 [Candidatus Dependentiae bacterium]|nr:hypothetical protein [Candidatus Dependentiae bacterium]
MKKIITLLILCSSILALNAKYDTDYFNDFDTFFTKLSEHYPVSICKRNIPLEQAEKEKATRGEKIATYHWNIYGHAPQVVLATVTLNSADEESRMKVLKKIDEHFTDEAKNDSHLVLRRKTGTPIGDPIAHYQNPEYVSANLRPGGQGKIVEVRLVP